MNVGVFMSWHLATEMTLVVPRSSTVSTIGNVRYRCGRSFAYVLVGVLAACSSSVVSQRTTATPEGTTAASETTPMTTAADAVIAIPDTTVAVSSDGLGATLERYREDDVPNRIQIQVVSRAAGLVTLSELRLASPAFTVLPSASTTHVVGPGERVDLPVQLGDARCSTPPTFSEVAPKAASFAEGKASIGGAAPIDIRIPITDTRGVIDRLFGPACTVKAVANAATIAFGATWTDTEFEGKPASSGTLRIERTNGTEPITITEIRGSVLLRFRPEKPPTGTLMSLAAGERVAEVPVMLVESGDCRPHAIADSKHTFFLPAVVTIGSNPTVIIDVLPDPKSQIQLSAMINRSCGL
jgi:hypothetical protein